MFSEKDISLIKIVQCNDPLNCVMKKVSLSRNEKDYKRLLCPYFCNIRKFLNIKLKFYCGK